MATNNRKAYSTVVRALKRQGLTHAQARVAWRGMRDRLERSPKVKDLKAHPRITATEVKRAPARERALRAAKTKAKKKAPAVTGTIVLPTKDQSPVKRGKGGKRRRG